MGKKKKKEKITFGRAVEVLRERYRVFYFNRTVMNKNSKNLIVMLFCICNILNRGEVRGRWAGKPSSEEHFPACVIVLTDNPHIANGHFYNLLTSRSQVFPFKTKIAILTGESVITSEDAQHSSMVSDIYAITLKFFTDRKAAIDWLRKTK